MIKSVASSKCEYSHGNCSLDMPSLMDEPYGWDKSIIKRTDPSFLGAEPMGEQWVRRNGGLGKGPAVCPRDISLLMASCKRVLFSAAERKFLGLVMEDSPVKPMSNPFLRPFTI